MTNRQDAPRDHAFLLRVWETRSLPPDPEATWRFSLEDLRTEEARKFPDLESLTAFLQQRVEEGGSNHGGSEGGGAGSQDEAGAETMTGPLIEASILLLETDVAIRRSVGQWLARKLPLCRIETAASDDEAVSIIEEKSPDVILVDVAPPNAGGEVTVRSLRDAAPAAQIVVLATDDEEERERLESAGADAGLAIWRIDQELVPLLRDLLAALVDETEGKTVVCIEDEVDLIDLVQLALANHGVELVEALGGEEGLDAVRRLKPDLVLLDLMMPDLDGWQVYQTMRADDELRHIPVIVMTVLEPYLSAKRGLDLDDLEGYVTKPFLPHELAERVSTALQVVA